MKKIVINICYSDFELSVDGVMRYLELSNKPVWPENDNKFSALTGPTYWLVPPGPSRVKTIESVEWAKMPEEARREHNEAWRSQVFYASDLKRDDPILVRVVEELGRLANGNFADLKVVQIPDDVKWVIEEYDGREWVAEKHRIWE